MLLKETHGITDSVRQEGVRIVRALKPFMSHRQIANMLNISPSTVSVWANS